jgi:serine/threonine protein kinase
LNKDPSKRPTALQLLEHPWIKKRDKEFLNLDSLESISKEVLRDVEHKRSPKKEDLEFIKRDIDRKRIIVKQKGIV